MVERGESSFFYLPRLILSLFFARYGMARNFVYELSDLLETSDAECRTLAYRLVLRLVKQTPTVVDQVLPMFLSCLRARE